MLCCLWREKREVVEKYEFLLREQRKFFETCRSSSIFGCRNLIFYTKGLGFSEDSKIFFLEDEKSSRCYATMQYKVMKDEKRVITPVIG